MAIAVDGGLEGERRKQGLQEASDTLWPNVPTWQEGGTCIKLAPIPGPSIST